MRAVGLALLAWCAACGSSSSETVNPIAMEYCASCSELGSCETVVTATIEASCTTETGAYYECVTEAECDASACQTEWQAREICMGAAPPDAVREAIDRLAPSANLGHRGTGPTREGHPYPENSISSFAAAIDEGADGIELDDRAHDGRQDHRDARRHRGSNDQLHREGGLQVNVWTVDTAALMQQQLDKGVTGIITDEPAVLAELFAGSSS